jgi:hypothetical protein
MRRTASRLHEIAEDIGVDDALQALGRHVRQLALLFQHADVVDQRRQRPQFFIDGGEQAQHVRLDADIGLHAIASPPSATICARRRSAAAALLW